MKNFKDTIIQLVVSCGMIYSSSLAADVSQKAQRVLCRHPILLPVSQKSSSHISLADIVSIKHKDFPGISIYSELDCEFSGNEVGLYESLSAIIKSDGYTGVDVYVFPGVEVARSQFILKLDLTKEKSTDTRYVWFNGDTGVLIFLDPGIQFLEYAIETGRKKVIASVQEK